MKTLWSMLLTGILTCALGGGRAEADDRRQEVRVSEDEVETLRVQAPRPQVTYVLLRAKLADQAQRSPRHLSRRIGRAVERDPF